MKKYPILKILLCIVVWIIIVAFVAIIAFGLYLVVDRYKKIYDDENNSPCVQPGTTWMTDDGKVGFFIPDKERLKDSHYSFDGFIIKDGETIEMKFFIGGDDTFTANITPDPESGKFFSNWIQTTVDYDTYTIRCTISTIDFFKKNDELTFHKVQE